MKKITLLSIAFFSVYLSNAQANATKVLLTKGQKIKMISNDTTSISQKRGEEAMEMKTLSSSATEVEIVEVGDKSYTATATVKKIKIDFDGYGQKMVYDSENPGKQEGMMADQLKNVVNKSDTVMIDLEGKKTEADEKGGGKGKGKGNGKGGGMMRMMNQGGTNIENAFLLVPAEAKEGSGWKKDAMKEEVKSQTIYFIEKIEGKMATVSFKKKTKGTLSMSGGQAGDMKVDMDNLSNGMITVDVTTGLVKTYTETTNSKSVTHMMGQEMPSTGTITSSVIFE